jgi:hypothetical protein
MEVGDIEPGMKGTGKTVFHGTEPGDFDVEVIAVLKGAGKLSDLVLIRASGQAIEAAGGIAEGMSGSPVYVDGRKRSLHGYGHAHLRHAENLIISRFNRRFPRQGDCGYDGSIVARRGTECCSNPRKCEWALGKVFGENLAITAAIWTDGSSLGFGG